MSRGTNQKFKFTYLMQIMLNKTDDDQWVVVSPWALIWDDEYYYMVAYDDWEHKIKHYRVDKMMCISIEEEKRSGKEEFRNFDKAEYSKATFGMYNGVKQGLRFILQIICAVYFWIDLEKIFHLVQRFVSRKEVDNEYTGIWNKKV